MASCLDNFIKNYAATREETKFYWGKQEETAFGKIQDSISSEETMALFNPSKPIILLTEASIHEGLLAALLQKSNRGIQPVHFISWTMTQKERNSQSAKDALTKNGPGEAESLNVLGAPKLTAHKPPIPLCDKVKVEVSPRIEKLILEMHHVDYKLLYKPWRWSRPFRIPLETLCLTQEMTRLSDGT